jgi:DNA mismatch repair protein MutL
MPKIIPLPYHVIARIAAGEVIERPVYAVKELLENSLDAGAQTIVIQIESGGLRKITVTDDGHGMEKEDLLQSFQPHTTSKFLDDSLIGIPTLGFRGEALSSISAVSNFTIQSRVKDSSGGWYVSVSGGEIKENGPIGMPQGTSVSIENLFFNIPARKKFLKSERSEYILILDLVTKYTLAYPHIRFLLMHNGKISIDVEKGQDHNTRINRILKKNIADHLMSFENEDDYLKISGYIAHPQISTSSQSKQFITINNRPVMDKMFSSMMKDAYGGLLPKNRYPIFLLSLEVPFEAVDVNVHPRKEQVSVVGKDSLISLIRDTVKSTLNQYDLRHSAPTPKSMLYRTGSTQLDAADILREEGPLWNVKDDPGQLNVQSIQQFNKTYLMCTSKKNIIIIDQHAAHERILYEQLMDTYKKTYQKINVLKNPISVDISEYEKEMMREFKQIFKKIGIQFDEIKNDIVVTHIPELLNEHNINTLIQEIIETAKESGGIAVDSLTHSMITYLSCRNAVKAGEIITEKEAKKLVEKLKITPNNTTCPHGRPTTIKFMASDLEKWFKRG